MLGQDTIISLTKLTDFQKYVNNMSYTSNVTLTDGQYTFDTILRGFRAKKEVGASRRLVVNFSKININEIHIGDTVEISLQCKNITGDKFRVAIDSSGTPEEIYISKNTNEWETMKIKHIIRHEIDTSNTDSVISLGLWTSFSGEFLLRDVVIKITTKGNKTNAKWIIATLGSGFTGTIEYTKNDLGMVTVKTSSITPGTTDPITTIANLPTGFRPLVSFGVPLLVGADGSVDKNLWFHADGRIMIASVALVSATNYTFQTTFYTE